MSKHAAMSARRAISGVEGEHHHDADCLAAGADPKRGACPICKVEAEPDAPDAGCCAGVRYHTEECVRVRDDAP
jgi:hypothetical protein